MTCPAPLGVGVNSKRTFCDVLTSRVPAEGILIDIPPHAGPVTLTFDLHNRHTYSEEQIRAIRNAYRVLYRSELRLEDAMAQLRTMAAEHDFLAIFVDFILGSTRGLAR